MTRPKRRRVLVLTHSDFIAPKSIDGLDPQDTLRFRTEFHVIRGLRSLGHTVEQLGLRDSLSPLEQALERFRPDIVFNLLMELCESGGFEPHVVAALEIRSVPYTGCNSEGLVLSRDKVTAKKLLDWHGIPVPEFASFRLDGTKQGAPNPPFPLIVKPAEGGGSAGISQASVVKTNEALRKRVDLIHRTYATDAIAERYIDGRELSIGLLGNRRPRCLPIWETHFDRVGKRTPRISTERIKWNLAHRHKLGVHSGRARRLPAQSVKAIERYAREAFEVLRLSGFARLDFRLGKDGTPWLIDVNPNPDIDFLEDFARSARAAGLPPTALLQRLVNLGIGYRAPWLS